MSFLCLSAHHLMWSLLGGADMQNLSSPPHHGTPRESAAHARALGYTREKLGTYRDRRKQVWKWGKPLWPKGCKTQPWQWQEWDSLKDISLTRIMKIPCIHLHISLTYPPHWNHRLSFNNPHWRGTPVCKAIPHALQMKEEEDTVPDPKTQSIRIHDLKAIKWKAKLDIRSETLFLK